MTTLQEEGYDVLAAGSGGDGFERRIRDLGVAFRELPVDRRGTSPAADLRFFRSLLGLYRREKPVLIHHFTIKPVIYGSVAARVVGGAPAVNTITGLGHVFIDRGRPWLRRLVESQYRVALRLAPRTFFLNRDDLDLFRDRGLVPESRATVMPTAGVDLQHFPSLPPPILEAGGGVTFLMLSRILREKGVYEFVEAARLVRRGRPEVRFVLAGPRDDRNPSVVHLGELERWREEGVVEWVGAVADVRPLLAKADVVVLPSYREGLPRALLEGAASARPLVATDVVGCREVVEHGVNGLLVPARDAGGLAAAMDRLAGDAVFRRRLGLAGRRKVEQEFDERQGMANLVGEYRRLVHGCHGKRHREGPCPKCR